MKAATASGTAITGATGRLGSRVAQLMATQGLDQRLIVRSPSRAPVLPNTTVHGAAYQDRQASLDALEGVQTLFMVSGAESEPDRLGSHKNFVDAAVAAGVSHIVYVSFFGAAPNATFIYANDHYWTEEHIKAAGVGWTFLRDNLYLDFLPALADEHGVIRGPAADGRVSAVAMDDIAESAAHVLVEPARHIGRTYNLTGPESLSLDAIADRLSRSVGRPFSFENETVEQAHQSRAELGASDDDVRAWVSTYVAIANGEMAAVSGDVEGLTGHPARGLEVAVANGTAY